MMSLILWFHVYIRMLSSTHLFHSRGDVTSFRFWWQSQELCVLTSITFMLFKWERRASMHILFKRISMWLMVWTEIKLSLNLMDYREDGAHDKILRPCHLCFVKVDIFQTQENVPKSSLEGKILHAVYFHTKLFYATFSVKLLFQARRTICFIKVYKSSWEIILVCSSHTATVELQKTDILWIYFV